jgi:SsrA-binding protein
MSLITNNPRAFHDYFIEEKIEAGLVLEGWEVKAIRAGRVAIKEAYVVEREGRLTIIGMTITPLLSASTHIHPDSARTRSLLLHAREIQRLTEKVKLSGYTLVPLDLHFSRGRVKAMIGLARGKKQHDKRESEKKRDWEREKGRIMRAGAKAAAADKA